jgi:glycosyltransferase involved in cell wall biosynthesis
MVGDRFPNPTAADLDHAARVLAFIPTGAVTIVDGLAAGAMPLQIQREAERLRFVVLVHHPLAHETGVSETDARRLRAEETRSLRYARHVVVTSPRTATLLVREYAVKRRQITCIEPGTDKWPASQGTGRNSLLCVATLTPRKGHLTLIRALARLTRYEWQLTCLGSLHRDPSTVRRVREEIRRAGLVDRVALDGETGSRRRLMKYYGTADVFVLPTEYEGYGMAIAEAIGSGLPVISTPTGAIPQLVGRDAGILVPRGNVNALANALRRVLGDPNVLAELRAGAMRRRTSLRSWAQTVRQFAAVVRKVARG